MRGKTHARRVRINRQGYDSHGHYYGVGAPVFYVYNEDAGFEEWVRASDNKSAITQVHKAKGYIAQ